MFALSIIIGSQIDVNDYQGMAMAFSLFYASIIISGFAFIAVSGGSFPMDLLNRKKIAIPKIDLGFRSWLYSAIFNAAYIFFCFSLITLIYYPVFRYSFYVKLIISALLFTLCKLILRYMEKAYLLKIQKIILLF